ncbi:MAG: hypothetical protein OXI60_00335 [Acidiferrobacterales bacterium]|nr:hypothetical protein [Acidiferrobacterales bacterium]
MKRITYRNFGASLRLSRHIQAIGNRYLHSQQYTRSQNSQCGFERSAHSVFRSRCLVKHDRESWSAHAEIAVTIVGLPQQ